MEEAVYEFPAVPLENGDEAVIAQEKELTLVVYHRDGSEEKVEGSYVPPGDAPAHPQKTTRI